MIRIAAPVAALIALTMLAAPMQRAAAQEAASAAAATAVPYPGIMAPQPSYDVLRVQQDGKIRSYHVWVDWLPDLVTLPDGSAWVFFGAQARGEDGLGPRKIFRARFDAARQVWDPASEMPGGDVQFGPSAVVDGNGVVHVVYSASSAGDPPNSSTLMYARIDGDGTVSDPVAVAPDANAGYQMMPSLAADGNGTVHLVWRDQRLVAAEARAEHPANANLFVSDLADGKWSAPVQLTDSESADAWPHLVVQRDRLVAVWSIYSGATDEAMKTASRIEWATRPLDDPNEWSEPATLLERTEGEIGGRLIDVAGNADGQIAAVYGTFTRATNDLALRRLEPGAADWSPEITLSSGDFGYMPSVAVSPTGELFIVFNAGRNKNVEVGGMSVPNDGEQATLPVSLTPAEDGLQARAVVAVTADGKPWIVYMHQPLSGNAATEIRALRGFDLDQAGFAVKTDS